MYKTRAFKYEPVDKFEKPAPEKSKIYKHNSTKVAYQKLGTRTLRVLIFDAYSSIHSTDVTFISISSMTINICIYIFKSLGPTPSSPVILFVASPVICC